MENRGNKVVTIRTFPTSEGDTAVQVPLRSLTEQQVFKPGFMVAMDGTMYTDWNELLQDLQKTENAVIEQFKPVIGG